MCLELLMFFTSIIRNIYKSQIPTKKCLLKPKKTSYLLMFTRLWCLIFRVAQIKKNQLATRLFLFTVNPSLKKASKFCKAEKCCYRIPEAVKIEIHCFFKGFPPTKSRNNPQNSLLQT